MDEDEVLRLHHEVVEALVAFGREVRNRTISPEGCAIDHLPKARIPMRELLRVIIALHLLGDDSVNLVTGSATLSFHSALSGLNAATEFMKLEMALDSLNS